MNMRVLLPVVAAAFLAAARASAQSCDPLPARIVTVDPHDNFVGQSTSTVIGADGFPVISYRDASARSLKVAKCGSAGCTAGNVVTTVSADNLGFGTSIAIGADGRPVVSYVSLDATAMIGTLKMARCGNPACTAGNTIAVVDDPANSVGYDSSIAVGPDGLPVISYLDLTAGALKVAKCGDPACTAGNTVTTVDDPVGFAGLSTSIAIGLDGLPVVSYRDAGAGSLKVVKCGNAACTGGNTITTVDDDDHELAVYGALAVGAGGRPVIAYTDTSVGAVKVAVCGNAACSAGNTIRTLDDRPGVFDFYYYIAIDVGPDGLPIVAYYDQALGALKTAKCLDAVQFASVAVGLDGLPVIAYGDGNGTPRSLRVARCVDPSCRCTPRSDFNADGFADLLWRHDRSGENAVWFMNGPALVGGTFTQPAVVADVDWDIVGTSDFNRDGRTDILWRHAVSGENAVWFMSGTILSSGTFTTPSVLADPEWRVAGTGDFNDDTRPDILWRHGVSGENLVWFMNGAVMVSGTFTVPSLADVNWRIGGVADFDEDGRTDILWHRQDAGQLVVWYMNGPVMTAGTFTNPPALADPDWVVRVVGDYNRDQRPDIVWRHRLSGENAVWFMNGATMIGGTFTTPSTVADTDWKMAGPR
jgi:hypothetical protein